MDKKRSLGVTITACWLVLRGILGLFSGGHAGIYGFAVSLAAIVIGAGLFRLDNRARLAAIALVAVIFVVQLLSVMLLHSAIERRIPEAAELSLAQEIYRFIAAWFMLGIVSFFLTRPKVKEQFGAGQ